MTNLSLWFTKDFDEKYAEYRKRLGVDVPAKETGVERRAPQPIKDGLIFTPDLKPEITTGDLVAYSDGTIRFKDEIIDLRNQMKDLCRLFMRHPRRLLPFEDIKNEIIPAPKRESTPNTTISKYVSELRSSLKSHFGRDVIHSQKEEGWYFDPTK